MVYGTYVDIAREHSTRHRGIHPCLGIEGCCRDLLTLGLHLGATAELPVASSELLDVALALGSLGSDGLSATLAIDFPLAELEGAVVSSALQQGTHITSLHLWKTHHGISTISCSLEPRLTIIQRNLESINTKGCHICPRLTIQRNLQSSGYRCIQPIETYFINLRHTTQVNGNPLILVCCTFPIAREALVCHLVPSGVHQAIGSQLCGTVEVIGRRLAHGSHQRYIAIL